MEPTREVNEEAAQEQLATHAERERRKTDITWQQPQREANMDRDPGRPTSHRKFLEDPNSVAVPLLGRQNMFHM